MATDDTADSSDFHGVTLDRDERQCVDSWLNEMLRNPQVPIPCRLLSFPLLQRFLSPARQEPVNGIAAGDSCRRDLAGEQAMIAKPSQI